MARPQLMPEKTVLERYLREGLTQVEMVARIADEYNVEVTRSAVAQSIRRHGLSGEGSPRYTDTVPWKVDQARHGRRYAVRMLRLLGRRRRGGKLNAEEASKLDSWLNMLAEANAVVGYDPEDPEGFIFMDPVGDDGKDGIPIHRPIVKAL